MSLRSDRLPTTRPRGGMPSMSPRQTEAYLLARDTVRRIQRTASLMEAIPHSATNGVNWNRQQRH